MLLVFFAFTQGITSYILNYEKSSSHFLYTILAFIALLIVSCSLFLLSFIVFFGGSIEKFFTGNHGIATLIGIYILYKLHKTTFLAAISLLRGRPFPYFFDKGLENPYQNRQIASQKCLNQEAMLVLENCKNLEIAITHNKKQRILEACFIMILLAFILALCLLPVLTKKYQVPHLLFIAIANFVFLFFIIDRLTNLMRKLHYNCKAALVESIFTQKAFYWEQVTKIYVYVPFIDNLFSKNKIFVKMVIHTSCNDRFVVKFKNIYHLQNILSYLYKNVGHNRCYLASTLLKNTHWNKDKNLSKWLKKHKRVEEEWRNKVIKEEKKFTNSFLLRRVGMVFKIIVFFSIALGFIGQNQYSNIRIKREQKIAQRKKIKAQKIVNLLKGGRKQLKKAFAMLSPNKELIFDFKYAFKMGNNKPEAALAYWLEHYLYYQTRNDYPILISPGPINISFTTETEVEMISAVLKLRKTKKTFLRILVYQSLVYLMNFDNVKSAISQGVNDESKKIANLCKKYVQIYKKEKRN